MECRGVSGRPCGGTERMGEGVRLRWVDGLGDNAAKMALRVRTADAWMRSFRVDDRVCIGSWTASVGGRKEEMSWASFYVEKPKVGWKS